MRLFVRTALLSAIVILTSLQPSAASAQTRKSSVVVRLLGVQLGATYSPDADSIAAAQYSAPIAIAAGVTDGVTQQPVVGATVTFTLGAGPTAQMATATTDDGGMATGVITIDQPPAPTTIRAVFGGDATHHGAEAGGSFTIVQEAASATYTGAVFVGGPCARRSRQLQQSKSDEAQAACPFSLSATVADEPAIAGRSGGDIRQARVTFVDLPSRRPLAGCVNLPVAATSPSAPQTGTAACRPALAASSGHGAASFTVAVVVGYNPGGGTLTAGYDGSNGYYASGSADISAGATPIVLRSSRKGRFVSGAGSLTLSSCPPRKDCSAGRFAGDAGSSFRFALDGTYGKSSARGAFTALIHHRAATGALVVYRVVSARLTRVLVQRRRASVAGTARITDITDPLHPLPVRRAARLTIVLRSGEAAKARLGVTLEGAKGKLLFSSARSKGKTVSKSLATGGIIVW